MTGFHSEAKALIEIDGLPSYKMGGSFHGKLLVSHNQMLHPDAQLHLGGGISELWRRVVPCTGPVVFVQPTT